MRKARCQVLDELAEIDALLGKIVKDDALPAEEDLDVHQVHLEKPAGDQFLAGGEGIRPGTLQRGFVLQVGLRCRSENGSANGILQERRGPMGRRAKNFSDLGSPVALNHDPLASRMVFGIEPGVLAEKPHPAVANDVSH